MDSYQIQACRVSTVPHHMAMTSKSIFSSSIFPRDENSRFLFNLSLPGYQSETIYRSAGSLIRPKTFEHNIPGNVETLVRYWDWGLYLFCLLYCTITLSSDCICTCGLFLLFYYKHISLENMGSTRKIPHPHKPNSKNFKNFSYMAQNATWIGKENGSNGSLILA